MAYLSCIDNGLLHCATKGSIFQARISSFFTNILNIRFLAQARRLVLDQYRAKTSRDKPSVFRSYLNAIHVNCHTLCHKIVSYRYLYILKGLRHKSDCDRDFAISPEGFGFRHCTPTFACYAHRRFDLLPEKAMQMVAYRQRDYTPAPASNTFSIRDLLFFAGRIAKIGPGGKSSLVCIVGLLRRVLKTLNCFFLQQNYRPDDQFK